MLPRRQTSTASAVRGRRIQILSGRDTTYRVFATPLQQVEQILRYDLGPPSRRHFGWPRELLKMQVKHEREVYCVRNLKGQQDTVVIEGRAHSRLITRQQ